MTPLKLLRMPCLPVAARAHTHTLVALLCRPPFSGNLPVRPRQVHFVEDLIAGHPRQKLVGHVGVLTQVPQLNLVQD